MQKLILQVCADHVFNAATGAAALAAAVPKKHALIVVNKILGLGHGLADKALPVQLRGPEFES